MPARERLPNYNIAWLMIAHTGRFGGRQDPERPRA
jgi:hypothetical protein